jgi:Mg2+-importing ATPase
VILLQRDLSVLKRGVEGGRHTFANTLKYINITTSANFGNMISMAVASPLLPFLPLLPTQILLNNFLSDLPSITISTDNVDPDRIRRAQRWDVRDVQRFMIVFGLTSSLFDFVTFALLLLVLKAGESLFQTQWFVVSLMTQLACVLVLRTRLPALRSRPSRLLLWATVAVSVVAVLLPYLSPVAKLFGLVALTPFELAAAFAIVAGYIGATEAVKRWLYRQQPRRDGV